MRPLVQGAVAAFVIALASQSAAYAQANIPDAKGCTPQERSNKALEDSGKAAGVICPPDIDPAMKAPTPKIGDPSVIPPPGSPGVDQSVQPK